MKEVRERKTNPMISFVRGILKSGTHRSKEQIGGCNGLGGGGNGKILKKKYKLLVII